MNGDAAASIPQVAEDKGKWTMTNDEVLPSYDDSTEMHFRFDSKNHVLHHYVEDDAPNTKYPLLDLVYLIDYQLEKGCRNQKCGSSFCNSETAI